MQENERLTHKRSSGINTGYWTACKKDELLNRLAEYEDTGFSPEEIRMMSPAEPDDSKFNKFLGDLREAVQTEVRYGMRSYTSKLCFIAEVLTITADSPCELCFTAGQIKKAMNVAKEV